MNALLPLLLPLAVATAVTPTDALADSAVGATSQGADLVEVHLGANTTGVRLVFAPPPAAGDDAEPYVIEVRAPSWGELAQDSEPALSLAEEPVDSAPALVSGPVLASAVPTASYATQPIQPEQGALPVEEAFLRHAPAGDLAPPVEPPQDAPIGSVAVEPAPTAAPPKEVEPPEEWIAASKNFEKACEGGYAEACTALADMVASGQAGPRDTEKAYRWYERGCDLGDDQACAAIAPIESSKPVAAPVAAVAPAVMNTAPVLAATVPAVADAAPTAVPAFQAERDLFDACSQGDNASCNELGERHTHGDGVSQDYPRAAKLFQRACAGGDMDACTNLGILYKVGEGVQQDELRAERLFQLACNGGAGDDRACGLAD